MKGLPNDVFQSAEKILDWLYPGWEHVPHMQDTPMRWLRALEEVTTEQDFEFTTFDSMVDEMIVVKDIDFVSLCAHHLVPFMGKAHVAYLPNGKIVGLSKIPRLVRAHSADLTVQEELTSRIAHTLQEALNPIGVGVVMEAEHMCATIRGVKAAGMTTQTSCMLGAFKDTSKGARQEFLNLIGKK